ncbi:MAG: L-threonine 3-dehydrogenase [Clostridia bacterium]
MMKAVVKTDRKPESIEIREKEIPGTGKDEVLIRITKAGICGTDYHIYKWDKWSEGRINPPVVLGHEFAGIVEHTGENVKNVRKGQRVSAEGHIVCGHCRPCLSGLAHICDNVRIIGVDRDGCFAEYLSMPAYNVWPLGDHISDRHGAIMDPLGNAMHTVMAQPVENRKVLITGAGSIGLFAVSIAKVMKASRVVVSEPNRMKRELALRIGADKAVDPMEAGAEQEILRTFDGEGPDVVLEMSGAKSAIRTGFNLIAKGGDLALLGIPAGEISMDFNNHIIFKGVTIRGISGRRMFETWHQCDDFLRHHAKDIDPVITHEMGLEDVTRGLEMMEKNLAVKVLLELKV